MIQWVFVSLNREDVSADSLNVSAHFVHWEGVGVQVHPSGKLRKYKHGLAWEDTSARNPVCKGIGFIERYISVDMVHSEIPFQLVFDVLGEV